ncbi:hypothetical protein ABU178_08565 [Pantoea osteomyelitidis]|uniref:DUF2157 domain-containing protein n=1 Tax=Pantoea osteomyelitidis TaxID=3230026 RepID=A0ABW7PWR6_9GAMM
MNNQEWKDALYENGFSAEEISILQDYIVKDNTNYLSLLKELKKRLFFSLSIIFMLLIVLIYKFMAGNQSEIIVFSITVLICSTLLYILTPAKLAYKATRILKKLNY